MGKKLCVLLLGRAEGFSKTSCFGSSESEPSGCLEEEVVPMDDFLLLRGVRAVGSESFLAPGGRGGREE